MSGGRRLTLEPFLAVFVGLILARLLMGGERLAIDLMLAATLLAGGFGPPFALRRRWWLVGVGVAALAVVALDASVMHQWT